MHGVPAMQRTGRCAPQVLDHQLGGDFLLPGDQVGVMRRPVIALLTEGPDVRCLVAGGVIQFLAHAVVPLGHASAEISAAMSRVGAKIRFARIRPNVLPQLPHTPTVGIPSLPSVAFGDY
jgi:hypothetical protein